ncbi:MAG: AbrB family transcriptional regulator [Gammaproteobacteria bacterium]|nr:AbrB family transcriptional regulator [Gammaproteobacteria bacterium]
MTVVTVSPKFQVVIPKVIREALGIKSGARLHAIQYRGRVELVQVKSPQEARGFLRGIDTTVPRDPDRT